jgi:hypothetical protein
MAKTETLAPKTTSFPKTAVENSLRKALKQLEDDTSAMREPWEPTFDSLAVVNVILVLESVLPGLKIAPEKVVRKGGYETSEQALQDIVSRIERQWNQRRTEK